MNAWVNMQFTNQHVYLSILSYAAAEYSCRIFFIWNEVYVVFWSSFEICQLLNSRLNHKVQIEQFPFLKQILILIFFPSTIFLGTDKGQCYGVSWCCCLLSCVQCNRFDCECGKCAPLNSFAGPNNASKHNGHTSFTRNFEWTSNHFGNNAG